MTVDTDVPPSTASVVIIGAGPVGLSLAVQLRLLDVDTVIIEKDLAVIDGHPKGRSTDLRTVEHYRQWGVIDAVRQQAWTTADPKHQVVITESLLTPPIGSFTMRVGRDEAEVVDLAAETSLSIPQPRLQRILEARAVELGAKVYRGWRAGEFAQDETAATAVLVRDADGASQPISARFVVGADGPSSRVRKAVGIAVNGEGPLGLTSSYVVKSEGHRIRDILNSSPVYDALGMLVVINQEASGIVSTPDDDNWGYGVFTPGADAPTLSEDVAKAKAQALLGGPGGVHFDIISRAEYRLITRIADAYRSGRFFVAGDAAHICPPTGGHNMNVGIDDSVNLAWKLAAVVQGWGSDALLDTYEAERRPVGLSVSAESLDNSLSMRRALERIKDTYADLSASERAEIAWQATFKQWNTKGITLDIRYTSPVIGARDGLDAPPVWHPSRYWNVAYPGHRAPHLVLLDGRPLIDHLGKHFTVIHVAADAQADDQASKLVAAGKDAGVDVTIVTIDSALAGTKYPQRFTLVRPDRFVSWVGEEVDDAASILARATGR
ncbi:hypothetical protein Q8F55_006115 [Vanrija albida]|uniref:FAD-binding domain-containing protein n=1 Tax=Vanrija albida TaxID=181172 RepID=A0ABR3Q4A9_9TREE